MIVFAKFACVFDGSSGPEDRAMICAGRNGATGRERSEDGADDRCLPTNSGVCAAGVASSPTAAQSPRRCRIRKALRKPRFPLRWVRRRRFLRLRPGKSPLPSNAHGISEKRSATTKTDFLLHWATDKVVTVQSAEFQEAVRALHYGKNLPDARNIMRPAKGDLPEALPCRLNARQQHGDSVTKYRSRT